MIEWLEVNASRDDTIPGAVYVGNYRGDDNSDWNVYDEEELKEYIQNNS